jgi:hypothetical protein
MGSHELDRLLRGVHALRGEGRHARRDALEREMSARHARLYNRRKRYHMWKHTPWFRPVVASLALLAIGIAACNAPTEYEVEVGQKLSIAYDGAAKDFVDFEAQIEPIVAYVDAWPGAEDVIVNVNEVDGGPVTLTLMVWGQNLDSDALQDGLVAEFPILADAAFSVEALAGSVEGNLGEAFGHAVFDFEVSGETAEEIRQQVLEQLVQQGFDGDAVVEVVDEDGQRTINIELNEIVPADEDAEDEDGGVVVIERRVE